MKLDRRRTLALAVALSGIAAAGYLLLRGPRVRVLRELAGGVSLYAVECPDSRYDCMEAARSKCSGDYVADWNGEQALEFLCASDEPLPSGSEKPAPVEAPAAAADKPQARAFYSDGRPIADAELLAALESGQANFQQRVKSGSMGNTLPG